MRITNKDRLCVATILSVWNQAVEGDRAYRGGEKSGWFA